MNYSLMLRKAILFLEIRFFSKIGFLKPLGNIVRNISYSKHSPLIIHH